MNARIDTTLIGDNHLNRADAHDPWYPECQNSTQPSANVGGISFSPMSFMRQTVAITGLALMGAISTPKESGDPFPVIEATFSFPDLRVVILEADGYSRIREEIVAAGLPMLSDDEVRSEIKERKGTRSEADS